MKTIRNIYSVEGIEIILSLRNYERVKTVERAPARGEGTLLQNFQQRKNETKKRYFILNVKSLDLEKSVAEKCSSMLDMILPSDCSNGKFTA